MSASRPQLHPDRLIQAAEAALAAAQEVAEHTGGPWPYPPDLMGTEMQPDALADFTKWEIEQASEFLVRLGALAPRPSKRAA